MEAQSSKTREAFDLLIQEKGMTHDQAIDFLAEHEGKENLDELIGALAGVAARAAPVVGRMLGPAVRTAAKMAPQAFKSAAGWVSKTVAGAPKTALTTAARLAGGGKNVAANTLRGQAAGAAVKAGAQAVGGGVGKVLRSPAANIATGYALAKMDGGDSSSSSAAPSPSPSPTPSPSATPSPSKTPSPTATPTKSTTIIGTAAANSTPVPGKATAAPAAAATQSKYLKTGAAASAPIKQSDAPFSQAQLDAGKAAAATTASTPAASSGGGGGTGQSRFGQAFSAARSAGEKEFSFGGKRYHTRRAGETDTGWKSSLGGSKPAPTQVRTSGGTAVAQGPGGDEPVTQTMSTGGKTFAQTRGGDFEVPSGTKPVARTDLGADRAPGSGKATAGGTLLPGSGDSGFKPVSPASPGIMGSGDTFKPVSTPTAAPAPAKPSAAAAPASKPTATKVAAPKPSFIDKSKATAA